MSSHFPREVIFAFYSKMRNERLESRNCRLMHLPLRTAGRSTRTEDISPESCESVLVVGDSPPKSLAPSRPPEAWREPRRCPGDALLVLFFSDETSSWLPT